MEIDSINKLVEQYSKHGWTIRRVLLGSKTYELLASKILLRFSNAEVVKSRIDAIWFSRVNNDAESWELRRLGGLPYALVRLVPSGASIDERDAILSGAELEIENSLRLPIDH